MPKCELSLSEVDTRRVYKNLARPKWAKDKPVNGYDTETSAGRLILLSWFFEASERDGCYWKRGETIEPELAFEALTHREARAALNVWYNLDFDANVILSALPKPIVFELQLTGQSTWNKCKLSYIPKKAFSIRRGKHLYEHFDVAQFYLTSLEKAAREWLGDEDQKLTGLDRSRFDDVAYILANEAEFLAYAKRDARAVSRLFRRFVEEAEPLNIPCGKPYSTGFLGEQYMNATFLEKPSFGFEGMQRLAWEAYQGGRFEVVRRGYIEQTSTFDINSAYPFSLSRLPDPSTLRWQRFKRPELEQIRAADFGFVRLLVSTDPRVPVQPFGVRRGLRIEYPSVTLAELVLLKDVFLAALDAGALTDFRVLDSWLGYESKRTLYPFGFLPELYDARKRFKKEGRELTQYILKKIINSVYGKTCQITERKHLTDEDVSDPQYFAVETMPKEIREWLAESGLTLTREYVAGSYFNPFFASYITGLTRLELWQSVIRSGLEDSVVMLATDSVMFTGDPARFKASIGDGLGQWEHETDGAAFVVGSGIYEVYPPKGKPKRRTRGFNDGVPWEIRLDVPLLELARSTDGPDIDISRKRPLKIGQALYQHFDLSRVGEFITFPRSLRAGMDSKRVWPRGDGVTWRQLTEGAEVSTPKLLAVC